MIVLILYIQEIYIYDHHHVPYISLIHLQLILNILILHIFYHHHEQHKNIYLLLPLYNLERYIDVHHHVNFLDVQNVHRVIQDFVLDMVVDVDVPFQVVQREQEINIFVLLMVVVKDVKY
jgi:hypothetical protein